jgi:hypothetical protein
VNISGIHVVYTPSPTWDKHLISTCLNPRRLSMILGTCTACPKGTHNNIEKYHGHGIAM